MLSRRERRRKRYAEDPEYRARILASNRAHNAAHKDALNARRRERRATDPGYRERCRVGRRGERGRRATLKLYGLSLEDYDALLLRQNGACAICERKSDRTLCVDHCHSTRVVRGLLCRTCNLGLGYFRDEAALFRKAIAYLRRARIAGAKTGAKKPKKGKRTRRVDSQGRHCAESP
jgi:hypothetical protein